MLRYSSRATLLLIMSLFLSLRGPARSGDFEVTCDSLPSGWTAGEPRSGGFSASRRGENPSGWGQISVSGSQPVTLEEAQNLVPPHPDDAVISWETTKFRERTAFVYHKRTNYRLENYQGSLIEFDRYFIQLSQDTWARIDLDRSCSHGRAVMNDGSEIPPGTVPMIYERKFIPVNAEAEVAQRKAEELQILNCLKFTLSSPEEPTTATPGQGDSEEIPWGLVIGIGGAAAVVGAAAAAAIKAAAKKKAPIKTAPPSTKAKTKDKKKEPKQQVAYVLQLSADQIKVIENAPAFLTVQVWKVDLQTKACRPATDAVIELSPPPSLPMLQISGRPSPGRLYCQLQLGGPAQISEAVLKVRAQAGGGSHGAEVRLTFDSQITMEFF